jgi:hypothetical protein
MQLPARILILLYEYFLVVHFFPVNWNLKHEIFDKNESSERLWESQISHTLSLTKKKPHLLRSVTTAERTVIAALEDTPLSYTSGNVFTRLANNCKKWLLLSSFVGLEFCTEQLSYHWKDFRKILYWWLLLNSVHRLKVWLKLDKNMGHLTYRPMYIYNISPLIWYAQKFYIEKDQRNSWLNVIWSQLDAILMRGN